MNRIKLGLAALVLAMAGPENGLAELRSERFEIPVPTPNVRKQLNEPSSRQDNTAGRPGRQNNEEVEAPAEPARIYQSACPALLDELVEAEIMPPVKSGQCGERSPLEVTAAGNVRFSSSATLNCRMAGTVANWLEKTRNLAKSILGRELDTLVVSTSYQCRRRNNAPTGKISEHGFANALDITGFRFSDSGMITVEQHWQHLPGDGDSENQPPDHDKKTSGAEGKFLKAVRDVACQHFTTVLGPEANAAHADHFHFDLGCHGKTCRYKICE